jgi:ribosome maturation factor RimP
MDREAIIDELRKSIGEFLKNQNLELVDLIYRYEGRDLVLRILVDRPEGGITLGECSLLNQDIGRLLDEKGILKEGFILEVYSPGLDRPLKTMADFLRCINRPVTVFLVEPIKGKLELEGAISRVTDDSVFINIQNESLDIPLSKIIKAKQVIGNI